MTAALKAKPTEPAEPEIIFPGPAFPRYEMIRPRTALTGLIGLGREFDCANGVIGKVKAITRIGESVVRVTVSSGEREAFVDLFGEWIGTISETGERWHKPVFVSPEVTAARKALEKLDPKDRAAALEGYTPRPAA